ncbi:MAG: endonuclease III [Candidatus Undinarchaeales archaeon]
MPDDSRVDNILKILNGEYEAKIALRYDTVFQLLVATILSARTTDNQVNKVTPGLFKKFKTPEDFVEADLSEIEKEIDTIGLYKSKAKYLKKTAKKIIEDFDGEVPDTMGDLTKLHGVARKTANVVLTSGFDKKEGIVVDTHVRRLSKRLGFTENKKPEKIEQDLMEIIPKKRWGKFSLQLIKHGRKVCKARKPLCFKCPIKDYCPYEPKTKKSEVEK